MNIDNEDLLYYRSECDHLTKRLEDALEKADAEQARAADLALVVERLQNTVIAQDRKWELLHQWASDEYKFLQNEIDPNRRDILDRVMSKMDTLEIQSLNNER